MATVKILQPGDTLSDRQGKRYSIEELLGSGGFGLAYRATDLIANKDVAIKILQPAIPASPALEEVFAREAEAAQQVRHKNITRTLAYVAPGDSGIGAPYMVMEYVAGGNLLERISAQNNIPFDRDVALDWMQQIAQGLRAIHERVLHRDIKPANVLVDGTILKICDFGMAKYVEESTRTLTLKGGGTWPYEAPETWQKQDISKATDIYSLGVLFYQLATLRLPFAAHDHAGWRQAHLFTPAPRPRSFRADLDERIDGMIVRMLSKRATDRFQSVDEIIDIVNVVASTPTTSSSAGADPVVRAARQSYDKHRTVQARQSARDEQRRDDIAAVRFRVLELADRFQMLVQEKNAWLPESPISIQRQATGTFMDALTGEMVRYVYLDKALILGFVDVEPDDLTVEDDPLPGFNPPGRQKKMVQREVQIDGASIAAIGFLKLATDEMTHRPQIGMVSFTESNTEHGIHLLLLRMPGDLYGTWKTCELDEHPMFHEPPVRQQVLLSSARRVVEALEDRMRAASHVVRLRDFSDTDFTLLLEQVVSS